MSFATRSVVLSVELSGFAVFALVAAVLVGEEDPVTEPVPVLGLGLFVVFIVEVTFIVFSLI